jgi:hypothetical protein
MRPDSEEKYRSIKLEDEEKDRRESRYTSLGTQIYDILVGFGLEESMSKGHIDINWTLLGESVNDYFEDIKRTRQFHGINLANVNKIYGYGIYWLLRRKPIQIRDEGKVSKENLFINEKVCVALLLSKAMAEMNVCVKDQERVNKFSDMLYYNFKYRAHTPQTLELMIEALFCGCSGFKVRQTDDIDRIA